MANAGRVELDLVAVGKDEVSAMLRKVEAQARQMATGMKEAGTATASVGSQLDDLKGKASGVNKVREVFENLRSNAFFVVGAVTGVVSALGAMVESLSANARAIADWERIQGQVAAQLERSKKAVEEINALIGVSKDSPMVRSAEEALAAWSALAASEEVAARAAKARREELDGWRQQFGEFMPVVRQAEDALRKAEHEHNQIRDERNRLEVAYLGLLGERDKQTRALFATLSLVDPFAETITVQPPKPPRRPGAVRRDSFDMGQESANRWAELLAVNETLDINAGDPIFDTEGTLIVETMAKDLDALEESLRKTTPQAEQFAQAFESVATALSSVSAELPEVVATFGELTTITTSYSEQRAAIEENLQARLAEIRKMNLTAAEQAAKEKQAQDDATAKSQSTLTQALAAGGTAIAANAAKAIGGVRAEAAVRAAYEVGMGFATLANPIESAGHFTAAALLGAVAAGAGGGGSAGGRASSGGGRESASSGGPSTIVYQFSTLLADQQSVNTGVRRASRAARGTGHESRAGV